MSLSHQALRVVTKDIAKITRNPPEDVRLRVNEDNIGAAGGIIGIVRGPDGTPYAGGFFHISFSFLDVDYPNQPPKCTMKTKMFHPNISKSGEICVDTLKKAWTKNLGIADVLVTIKCLLIHPNPESALDEEAGKLLLEDYQEYARMAKLMTKIHASCDLQPEEFKGGPETAPKATLTASAQTSLKPIVASAQSQTSQSENIRPVPLDKVPIPPVAKAKPPTKTLVKKGLRRL